MTLVLTGFLGGILAFVGGEMLLQRDLPGDTPSPELALLLMAGALVVTVTGIGVALAMPWSRGLRQAVGLGGSVLGLGGLVTLLVPTVMVAGSFPDALFEPLNLSIGLGAAVTGLVGVALLRHGTDPVPTGSPADPSPEAPLQAVMAGLATGIATAWVWGAVVWPLLPDECCRL